MEEDMKILPLEGGDSTSNDMPTSELTKLFMETKIKLMECKMCYLKEKKIRKLFTSGLINLNDALTMLDMDKIEGGENIRNSVGLRKCPWIKSGSKTVTSETKEDN